MRKDDWPETDGVSGIECVGLVHSCSGGEFKVGTKVAALMGGMGHSIPGSYAEYTRVPRAMSHRSSPILRWEDPAALPESYTTAWTCIFKNLEITKGQTLLVRGGTSTLGQAAINLAIHARAKVIATSRNPDRAQKLLNLGVERVELEGPNLSKRLPEKKTIDAVYNLVGNSVMLDSLEIPRRAAVFALQDSSAD